MIHSGRLRQEDPVLKMKRVGNVAHSMQALDPVLSTPYTDIDTDTETHTHTHTG